MKTVFYDLETNGLNVHKAQICQISAYFDEGKKKFHKYMIPTCYFDPRATQIHNLFVEDGELFKQTKNGQELVKDAVTVDEGLELFVEFLTEVIKFDEKQTTVLVSLTKTRLKTFQSISTPRSD